MKTKHNEERFHDTHEFSLMDDDDEILGRVDKPLLLLRQIDRINRMSTAGSIIDYINAINHTECLIPQAETDKNYQEELKKLNAQYDIAIKSAKSQAEKLNLDCYYHQYKMKALIKLMARRGMW